MESKIQEAVMRHRKGYNCSQAVACTYSDDFGMKEEDAYRLCEGFGSGMGGLKDTCGAASAMFFLAGLANSDATLASKATRPQTYQLVREMATSFSTLNNHLMCKEIMQDVNDEGIRHHSCEECVRNGAKIVEEYLLEQKEK